MSEETGVEIGSDVVTLASRKRKKADIEGGVTDMHSPDTLAEAKQLRSAGKDVSTDNLSVDDKRQYIEWIEDFRDTPELAPKKGNEKLAWISRPTRLTGIAGSSATDGQVSSTLTLKIEFEEEELKLLPQCIAGPAVALLKESRSTDSGKNSARVLVRRDWRTMTYRFTSPNHDEIKLIADVKGEPEFAIVQDKSEERLVLKIKITAQISGNPFAQLAQMLQSQTLSTECYEEQQSLLEH